MYKRGAVVLVPFPFTDLSGNKVRPAIIVSTNRHGDDIVVVFISSKKSRRRRMYEIPIIPDGHNGLKKNSTILCSKIATLDTKIVLGELGNINKATQKQVIRALEKLLTLK